MGWLPSLPLNYIMKGVKTQIDTSTYNPKEIVAALSAERLKPYSLFTPYADEIHSIVPYDLVQWLSSMLFTPLQYFEVTLRNRLYVVLEKHYMWRRKKYKVLGDPAEWLKWMPTKQSTIQKVNDAYTFAQRNVKNRPVVIGDIISGLSLGVWIDILKEHPKKGSPYHFWTFTQNKIFPNAKNQNRETICAELLGIKKIRNRLFHHEPIWNEPSVKNCHMALSEILKQYERVMRALRWLSIDVYMFLWEEGREYLLKKQALKLSNSLLNLFSENKNNNLHSEGR